MKSALLLVVFGFIVCLNYVNADDKAAPDAEVSSNVDAKPKAEIVGDVIKIGNKGLRIRPNSLIELLADNKQIASLSCMFNGKNTATGAKLWFSSGNRKFYDQKKSKLKKEGNKFIYTGYIKIDKVEWKQYQLVIELQDDGLIRIDTEWFVSPDKAIDLKVHSIWVNILRKQIENHYLNVNGKKIHVKDFPESSAKGLFGLWKGKKFSISSFAKDKNKKFTVLTERKNNTRKISGFIDQYGIRFNLYYSKDNPNKMSFYIDLR